MSLRFATADTSSWSWEKTGFNWAGDGTGAKKITLKKGTIIPQVIVFIKRERLLVYDVTFIKRCCWAYGPGGYSIDPTLVIGSYGSASEQARLEALSILEENNSVALHSLYEMKLVLCGLPNPHRSVTLPARRGLSPVPRRIAMQLDVYEVMHHRDTGQLPVRLLQMSKDSFPSFMRGVALIVDLGFHEQRNESAKFAETLVGAGFDMKPLIYAHRCMADPKGDLAIAAAVELMRASADRFRTPIKMGQTDHVFDGLSLADFMYLLSNNSSTSIANARTELLKRGTEVTRDNVLDIMTELYLIEMPAEETIVLHSFDTPLDLDTMQGIFADDDLEEGLHIFCGASKDCNDISADAFAEAGGFDLSINGLSPTSRAAGSALPQTPPHLFFGAVFKWHKVLTPLLM